MQKIRISDITMKQSGEGFDLSFKNKIELSKLLDKLGVSVIELEGIENPRVDSFSLMTIGLPQVMLYRCPSKCPRMTTMPHGKSAVVTTTATFSLSTT